MVYTVCPFPITADVAFAVVAVGGAGGAAVTFAVR